MLQHCVALKIVVANRLVYHLNEVDLFCLDLNHIVNSRREKKKIAVRCVGEWCQISLALLLVNCHDVTFEIFYR